MTKMKLEDIAPRRLHAVPTPSKYEHYWRGYADAAAYFRRKNAMFMPVVAAVSMIVGAFATAMVLL